MDPKEAEVESTDHASASIKSPEVDMQVAPEDDVTNEQQLFTKLKKIYADDNVEEDLENGQKLVVDNPNSNSIPEQADVDSSPTPNGESNTNPSLPPVVDTTSASPDKNNQKIDPKKMIQKRLLWILFGVCVLVAIVAGVLASGNKKNENKNSNNSLVPNSSDNNPTSAPTGFPSSSPITPSPTTTDPPSESPTDTPAPTLTYMPSANPTLSPTNSPSTTPTEDYVSIMENYLSGEHGITFIEDNTTNTEALTPSRLALEWLAKETLEGDVHDFDRKLAQRYALVTTDISLNGFENIFNLPLNAEMGKDECDWPGIKCNGNGWVREINWDYMYGDEFDESGVLAPEIGLLEDSLKVLDLSNNGITGEIPESLYELTNLEKLYLFKNQLEGTISTNIGKLTSLTLLHMSHNKITGSIPEEVKGIRPLRKYILLIAVFETKTCYKHSHFFLT